jgi:MoaA/NifB/PqqE/SkfB family radical SAM enzyme
MTTDPGIQLAIKKLSDQYSLLGEPIDLSWLELPNGEAKIFNSLEALRCPIFENNQRLVVVQSKKDMYSYSSNIASDSLIFLQQCLQKIDISNFFVVLITSNPEIEHELEWLAQYHSTDSVTFEYVLIDTEFEKQTPTTDTFCVNMWKHLYVSSQLEILPCCVAKDNRSLGSLVDHTVEEIVNSNTANTIRNKMLTGKKCIECETCYIQENAGQSSRRIVDNNKFKTSIEELKLLTNCDGSLKNFSPATIDIRLNNICNLKCRTCSGVSSSQLAAEEKKLFNNPVNFNKTPTTQTRTKVLESIIDYFDNCEEIYFAGGEPLILKEHFDILDRLLLIGKTDIPIKYTTNFTNLTFKNKNIIDYWKQFSNITVGASLDGHGTVFEYVRHGANWKDIEKNLIELKDQCPHVKFFVTSTISLLSVESVMELQKMWHELKILDISNFYINLMVGNDYLSLQSLRPEHKKMISSKIDQHCKWLRTTGCDKLDQAWQKIQQYMMLQDKSYVNKQFSKVNQARDVARNENFESIYPQFIDLFQPYYTNNLEFNT